MQKIFEISINDYHGKAVAQNNIAKRVKTQINRLLNCLCKESGMEQINTVATFGWRNRTLTIKVLASSSDVLALKLRYNTARDSRFMETSLEITEGITNGLYGGRRTVSEWFE